MNKSCHIGIIGAGVIGLSTALSISQKVPSAQIHVFADQIGDDTLSAGAGGLFRPETTGYPDKQLLIKWCQSSLAHFYDIFKSPEGSSAGVQLVSGYHLSSNENEIKNPLLEILLPDCRKLRKEEISLFSTCYKSGIFYTTIIVDCRYYLPWMKSKFEESGGKVTLKHISNLSEISDDFDVLINCAGLRAKNLVTDDLLIPVRGQTIKVKAPWIKHFYYGDDVYVIPGVDYVTLGGIKDYGSWNMKVNTYQKQFIWDKCLELVPSLKKAEIAWDWVGLRPYRPFIRVDANLIQLNGKYKKVINNYGHGGHGVSLSWGTAQETAELVTKILTQQSAVISKL